MKRRYEWIYILKGIGIISVIIVHVTDWKNLFVYALPLFFILSGYLFTPQAILGYVSKMSKRLLIPYCSFFLLITCANFHKNEMGGVIKSFIYGGIALVGDYGVFWYIEVLFISLIINTLIAKTMLKWLYAISFCLAVIVGASDFYLPWNIQSIPLVLTYLFIGMLLRERYSPDCVEKIAMNDTVFYSFMVMFVVFCAVPNIYFDIKYNYYGLPVVSFVISIVAVSSLALLSTRINPHKVVGKFLSYCGKASLFLMFVHQFIHYRLFFINNVIVQAIATIIISVSLYFFLCRFKICRKFLFGED